MKNFKQFLSRKTDITHGERLVCVVCTAFLTGMGLYLNNKLFETRIDLLDKQRELDNLHEMFDGYRKVVTKCNEVKETISE